MSVAIIGAGAFGTALAVSLATKGPVTLWGRDTEWADTGENPRLPGVPLPPALRVTDRLDEITAETVLLALPAQVLGGFLAEHGAQFDRRNLVSCAKGIDLATLTGPSALIAAACPQATVAVLTGPSFAADIARGLPTALTLACADAGAAEALQRQLSTATLRLYRTTDVTGAELGGALKNIIAIAAGAAIGAGYGDSARASVVTRGFAEMLRLATALGARPETLPGLSGLGDLVLTCTSEQSRNFRYGLALGSRRPFAAGTTVEGASTARAVTQLAERLGIEMPISNLVAGLAEGRIAMEHALDFLLNRPLKEE
ncbi:NAD(P)H-dependent glycerol-3-phosphate dehydrogenase [Paracoccus denitrificans]|jgi:glycerol-3-phosphate dehydrogenase (NAD(P)+)|uniref:Glycerol-3-phosphate dehydrogenase [NAD(P)+] n=1 Tax=Paracoccus denitrificans (strain Pd 1222) TaxID=318586 RepID=GPDA_PARDP|nr:NAD(P)H-dependent glycerol-3-phosphate dehydrogenase [Paracoccus denitrificans]A1B3J7.1 RecName: Full=Glycerol-3-phosphate dehydrogenase [NAD(P)+]; AltName: Full=NAD(P)H-dependent glycerol-3-phosphate dehydrogenase [Paracoccus denitrificans PD1222]ABL70091.1 Glycerol-3-phosphate dehydrogenase (NAD(P)(+)) [Paracoccus denitrificans PD1222]MBB4628808.1 glycerol-3-phosphate dehydrogenase (NAD(P)+) [Paracoccus denitrificans]MCU7429809.1 NAD(P)-dependent glycerol-3-phosphate dehydrogenase [Paracoc